MKTNVIELPASEVLALRAGSQQFQAEGRTPSENKEKTNGIKARFNDAEESGLAWPIGLDYFTVATVDGKRVLLGGFHTGIGFTGSNKDKDSIIPVADYGDLSMAEAMQVAGATNLHHGTRETPLQKAIRIQAIVANGGDLEESLALFGMKKSSFNQYVSILANLPRQVRKALVKGELTDGEAKAIRFIHEAKEDARDLEALIADKSNVTKKMREIQQARKQTETNKVEKKETKSPSSPSMSNVPASKLSDSSHENDESSLVQLGGSVPTVSKSINDAVLQAFTNFSSKPAKREFLKNVQAFLTACEEELDA